MSTRTYPCTVPEQRSTDRKHLLLVVGGFFTLATVLAVLAGLQAGHLVLQIISWFIAVPCACSAVLSFWAWWDVRNDDV